MTAKYIILKVTRENGTIRSNEIVPGCCAAFWPTGATKDRPPPAHDLAVIQKIFVVMTVHYESSPFI